MEIEEAIENVERIFPFPGYMRSGAAPLAELNTAYGHIAVMVLKHIPPGSRVLDFGCGPCDKTAVLQAMGYTCFARDDLNDPWHALPGNKEKIIQFARKCGISLSLGAHGATGYEDGFFDMVMLNHVLEHLHDSPREILNDLLRVLKPEGFLFVTVPNAANLRKRVAVALGRTNLPPYRDYFWSTGPWRGHVREYVRDDLVKLAMYLNCDIVQLEGCDHMLQRVPRQARFFYLMMTKIMPSLKDSWVLVAKKRNMQRCSPLQVAPASV